MPTVLMGLLYYVFYHNFAVYNLVAPLLLGLIPFILMFIVTSVAVLRERTTGTLERLLVSPASRLDIVLGYTVAFALLALIQAAIVSLVTVYLFDVQLAGSVISLLIVAILSGIIGMSFGLLFSTFAHNEFQAVQFMPAFVMPQFLTCGLFISRDKMAEPLQYFADIMPITYVVKALEQVKMHAEWSSDLTFAVAILGGFILLSLVLGTVSLRSRTM
jgi:ABC-2 type transport system permease protein